ncbi:hypothetical protein P2H44_08925 [Albimonas sp. CAU 1670]|uniref:hypothetical protein n=1 Tax=Albimonas sp. CAU 1670 TaxID=3032599 RepID=UPI0023DAED34|nr:hypothetical protein [Albimonas sp. CAU 1670]MDF2232674.1 hypothetical protein [Albimonas sp. CAU 1670]
MGADQPRPAPRPSADPLDPRGLIAEAYRMPGIDPATCRAIFFDWALGRSAPEGEAETVRALHDRYAPDHPEHPMTAVLAEGLATLAAAPARTGRRRRRDR